MEEEKTSRVPGKRRPNPPERNVTFPFVWSSGSGRRPLRRTQLPPALADAAPWDPPFSSLSLWRGQVPA